MHAMLYDRVSLHRLSQAAGKTVAKGKSKAKAKSKATSKTKVKAASKAKSNAKNSAESKAKGKAKSKALRCIKTCHKMHIDIMNLTCTCDPCLMILIEITNLIEIRVLMMPYMSYTSSFAVPFVPGML
jgi:hypothetical protein